MMKNRITKYVINGTLLAVMAAAGITVYQLGTDSGEEVLPEETRVEEALLEEETVVEDPLTESVDTAQVEANMDEMEDTSQLTENQSASEIETSASEVLTDEETVDTVSEELMNVSAGAISLPTLDFSENTLMEWPVHGTILLDYSMDQTIYFPTLDQYRLNPAISVQAVEGAPVMASVDGIVYSVTENAQTGTTVTMEIGNGFQAIYGQLCDLTIEEGDAVTKGTIIGYVDTPTKYYSREGSNVYFAMKENGKPVDPIAYLP